MKIKLPKAVNICGKTYSVHSDKNRWGGSCSTGSQKIVVGTAQDSSSHRRFTTLVHEILEGVFLERRLRYEAPDEEIVFVMTHKQFSDCAMDVATAIMPMIKGSK